MNVQLKACAHCGGDVFIERDIDGDMLVCLQCGRSTPVSVAQGEQCDRRSAGVA